MQKHAKSSKEFRPGDLLYVVPRETRAMLHSGSEPDGVSSGRMLSVGDIVMVLNVKWNRVHVLTKVGPGWLKEDLLFKRKDFVYVAGFDPADKKHDDVHT